MSLERRFTSSNVTPWALIVRVVLRTRRDTELQFQIVNFNFRLTSTKKRKTRPRLSRFDLHIVQLLPRRVNFFYQDKNVCRYLKPMTRPFGKH